MQALYYFKPSSFIKGVLGLFGDPRTGITRASLSWVRARGSSMSSATWLILKWVVVKIMIAFLGTPNDRCGIILGTQKGAIIFATTQLELWGFAGLRSWSFQTNHP